MDIFNSLDSCILRFSNVYGPRQNANGEAGVISIFINRLLTNENISIYDGSQTRDFVYVKDIAIACRLAMEGKHKGVFNISSCTERSLMICLIILLRLWMTTRCRIYKPRRIGEIERSVLDNRKALHEFDWRLQYSLSEGLKETVQFYSKGI